MLRKLAVLVLLGGISIGLGGCFTINSEHNARIIRTWYNDLEEMHKTTDKYFWNYDEDDPFGE